MPTRRKLHPPPTLDCARAPRRVHRFRRPPGDPRPADAFARPVPAPSTLIRAFRTWALYQLATGRATARGWTGARRHDA